MVDCIDSNVLERRTESVGTIARNDTAAASSTPTAWTSIDDVVRRVIDGKRVLDYGCGSGERLADLARRGYLCAGVESSPALAEFAAQSIAAMGVANAMVRMRSLDLGRVPFATSEFDLVFSADALASAESFENALIEAARVVHAGGRIVVECPGPFSTDRIAVRRLRPSELRRAALAADFTIEEVAVADLDLLPNSTPEGKEFLALVGNSPIVAALADRVIIVLRKFGGPSGHTDIRRESATKIDPEFSQRLLRKAEQLLAEGAIEDAASALMRAALHDPSDAAPILALARLSPSVPTRRRAERLGKILDRRTRRTESRRSTEAVAAARPQSGDFSNTAPEIADFAMPPLDGMQTEARLRFLHGVVTTYGRASTKKALEIGCYKGSSTVVLAQACARIGVDSLTSLDLFTGTPSWGQKFDTMAQARRRIDEFGVGAIVRLERGDSKTAPWTEMVDILHIDGDHTYEAVRSDIRRFTPCLVPGGIVIFDDYDPAHPGVEAAVDEFLSAHPEFEIAARHDDGDSGGSLCVRKKKLSDDHYRRSRV
jgi:SAM-dependent methyltransferase